MRPHTIVFVGRAYTRRQRIRRFGEVLLFILRFGRIPKIIMCSGAGAYAHFAETIDVTLETME